jgi:hypothetical protein
MPTPITAAVTYIADSIPPIGSDLRTAADTRVAELIAEKVKAMVQVNHELSPALPRDPCYIRPHREYVASAEIIVMSRSEYARLLNEKSPSE